MTGIYINGAGNISPQNTFDKDSFLEEIIAPAGTRLNCIEPEYGQWIDSKSIRRMSRVIRMGVAAAGHALREAGLSKPDGIITGTGFGCLDDTGIFLSKMVANDEQSLNPTPFIQSTHNSIGSQIGLLLQCQGYNQTYVQGGFSIEASLMDAIMTLHESSEQSLLVGGADEITDVSHAILSRFGLYRHGTAHGEGAAYFLLSTQPNTNTYARLTAVRMIYGVEGPADLKKEIKNFLTSHSLNTEGVDLVLFGKSSDHRPDEVDDAVVRDLWESSSIGTFKNLCGEYPTSTGFALWLAASILKKQIIPDKVAQVKTPGVRNILVFNTYLGVYRSLILLQRAEI